MIGAWFLFALLSIGFVPAQAQDLPAGIIAGSDYKSVPVPSDKYQIYLIGEFHGAQETKSFLVGFLARLHQQVGLRDIALEEDQVYQRAARDYVDGKSTSLRPELCLRTDVLDALREFNRSLSSAERLKIHLVDIDSPIEAIREHLLDLKKRLGAQDITIPDAHTLPEAGIETVGKMKELADDESARGELETIRNSLVALGEGIEIGTSWGDTKGNVLAEPRERAIAQNMLNVLRNSNTGVMVGFYGVTHVCKKSYSFPLPDGRPFTYQPLALRLLQGGVTVAAIDCSALSGTVSWRGGIRNIPPQAPNFRLSENESMEQMLEKAPTARFFWVDLAKYPHSYNSVTQEKLAEVCDFLFLVRQATPMKNACMPQQQ